MTKTDFKKIAECIWRAGYIKDKNKIRQQAREKMRHLIASNIIGEFSSNKNFNEYEFTNIADLHNL